MAETIAKSYFTQNYDAEAVENEFLYNLIAYVLEKDLGLVRSGATRYDYKACTYSVYNDLDLELLRVKCLQRLSRIQELKLLYSYDDTLSLYLDKCPLMTDAIFSYLPYRTLYSTTELQDHKLRLMQKLSTAVLTKRSTLLKVNLI